MNELASHHLGVAYQGHWLIQQVNLVFPPQSLIALVGPNGAGKTTLLRLLAGLCSPTTGQATLNKQDLQDFPRRELARHITYVPQVPTFNFAFTVQEIVAMGRNPHLGRFQRESDYDRYCIEKAMAYTDIIPLAHRLNVELSGGERQRVALACSLATEADIVLLDEPTASLDIAHALEILDLCQELVKEGKTMIFSMHDINLALRYAEHVILLQKGQIVSCGEPRTVLTPDVLQAVFGVKAKQCWIDEKEFLFLFRRC